MGKPAITITLSKNLKAKTLQQHISKRRKGTSAFEEIQKEVMEKFNSIPKIIKPKEIQKQKIAAQNAYNNVFPNKTFIATLLNDNGQYKTKEFPIELSISENDSGVEIKLVASNELFTNIFYLQSKGSAIGVDPKILEVFEVEEDNQSIDGGDVAVYSNWYFNPTNQEITFNKAFHSELSRLS